MGGECLSLFRLEIFSLRDFLAWDMVFCLIGEWWRSGCFLRLRGEVEARICCEEGGGGMVLVHKGRRSVEVS